MAQQHTAIVGRRTDALLAHLSDWIDEGNVGRHPEAAAWGRVAKIGEEFGEVIEAFIGATGQNPRKGYTHTTDDVRKELLDVAVTALAAYEHLTGNVGRAMPAFRAHVIAVFERATVLAHTFTCGARIMCVAAIARASSPVIHDWPPVAMASQSACSFGLMRSKSVVSNRAR